MIGGFDIDFLDEYDDLIAMPDDEDKTPRHREWMRREARRPRQPNMMFGVKTKPRRTK